MFSRLLRYSKKRDLISFESAIEIKHTRGNKRGKKEKIQICKSRFAVDRNIAARFPLNEIWYIIFNFMNSFPFCIHLSAKDRARENEVAADIAAEFAKHTNNAPFESMAEIDCCLAHIEQHDDVLLFTIFQLTHAKMFIAVLASCANQKMM